MSDTPLSPVRYRSFIARRLAVADAVAIATASVLAYWLRSELGEVGLAREFANEVPTTLAILPLWLLIFLWAGAYRPEYLNEGGDAFRRFSAAVVSGILALGFASFVLDLRLSRLFVVLVAGLVFLFGGLARLVVRRIIARRHRQGTWVQRVLIAGTDPEARELAAALGQHARGGYRVVGHLDATGGPPGTEVVGRFEDALRVAREHGVGLVIISPTGVPPGTLQEISIALEGSPIDLAVAPSLFQVVSRRMTIETVANVPILHVDQIRLERGKAALKRTLDLIVATGLSLLLLPVWIAAALAVRLDDRGPALFRQTRVGREGETFTILKFRTMVSDAEERLVEVEHLNEVGHGFFKVREDPRVTRVGAFLRKWSVDEIPQLWNVLRGDMSMVGPRPPLPDEVERYELWQLRRLRVRPGITGVWQVSGRSHVAFDEAVRMDLFYIENWSLGYDLFLLGKTVLAVLGRRGAY